MRKPGLTLQSALAPAGKLHCHSAGFVAIREARQDSFGNPVEMGERESWYQIFVVFKFLSKNLVYILEEKSLQS